MFFILSKVLDFLLSPLIWVILFFAAGIIIRKPVLKKRFIDAGIILLIIFSNPFLASEAFRAWEGEPQPLTSVSKYEVGIVLTGVAFNKLSAPDRVFFSRGADRVLHTVELYKAGKIKKVLIAGGSGLLIREKLSESSRLKEVMIYCGVPDSVISIENKSRNTRESAIYTRQLADSLNGDPKFLLITSAFHIPRALGCFRKVGMAVDGYGVDYYNLDRSFDLNDLFPNVNALYLWGTLIHELVGFGVYQVLGYI